jgi:transposase
LRGEQIRTILSREYAAEYSLGGTYVLLHRLGFSSLVPRPFHPERDLDAQENFKKTFSRGC